MIYVVIGRDALESVASRAEDAMAALAKAGELQALGYDVEVHKGDEPCPNPYLLRLRQIALRELGELAPNH